MLTLAKIIEEADVRVPNPFDEPQKVDWLNELERRVFDVVKIPLVAHFNAITNLAEYSPDSGIRSKNIDKVFVGTNKYESIQYGDVQPGRNFWSFDDTTKKLNLVPAPLMADVGLIRYHKISTTTFTSDDLTVSPEAPEEYHWLYVPGLCELIAKALDDVVKANNYAEDFNRGLMIAAQNYQKAEGR